MSLVVGTRLGPFQVESLAGAGGMGEVYKARDTRLDRTVAIKVLPPHVADDPERRRRFEQEARAVSALNHPRICTLHDIGSAPSSGAAGTTTVDYLVMEYVEGQTLAERLENGPLPLPQALEYARQIAEALAAAHQAGVVHRDLKPGNIMLTKGGVKLLDFGLAKLRPVAVGTDAGPADVLTRHPSTTPGSVLGTVQYMAPEQLEGREVDARADIWALGCVLYEMTTGRQAFEGRSRASLIAAIMEHEPAAMRTIAPMSPPALDHLVARCLAKDPDERWQSARDVLHELAWVAQTPLQPAASGPTARRRARLLPWAVAIVALSAAVVAFAMLRKSARPPEAEVMRFAITAPGTGTALMDPTAAAISPDGRRLVFTVVDSGGVTHLMMRSLDSLAAEPVAGTENALQPFWSPDGRFVAFFSDGKLRKAAITGGPPEVISDAPDPRGGSWSKDDVIVFAPAGTGSLYQVSADGGDKIEVARPDASRGERALRFPAFLPDGRHFLFVSLPKHQGHLLDVYLGSLDSKEHPRIMTAGSAPVAAGSDYLLFPLGDRLVAQRFDPSTLRPVGTTTSLGNSPPLSNYEGAPVVAASSNGILVHPRTAVPNTDLVWLDRAGHQTSKIALPTGVYVNPAISPDGRWIAVERQISPTTFDLWLVDVQRGVPSRLTFDGHVSISGIFWSPDSTRIAYQYNGPSVFDIWIVSINGSPPEPLVQSSVVFKQPQGWSKDGKYVVFSQLEGPTGWDLWLMPMQGDRTPVPYLRTTFNEIAADVSPDNRWLAYSSDETGTQQIYVRSFPRGEEKHQVSMTSGTGVQWSRDGREILMWTSGQFLPVAGEMSVVDVRTSPTFDAGTPRPLFTPPQDTAGLSATADLKRFVAAVPAEGQPPPSFTVVLNWQAALRR